jgi:DNA-binding HxlR family transcriptional regulator
MTGKGTAAALSLPAPLSRVLVAFTIDFEREPGLPLAISANALRVLIEEGARVADLPRLAGISKEAASGSLSVLESHGYAEAWPEPSAGQRKVARLTPKGSRAQDACQRLLAVAEERWQAQYGRGPHRHAPGVATGASRLVRRRPVPPVRRTAAVPGRMAGAQAVPGPDHGDDQ